MLCQLAFLFSDSVEDGAESGGVGWGLVAFAVVIVIMALMPRIVRRIRSERIALQKQEQSAIENAPNIRSQADRILVDLADISREISAQVDVKIRVLNKLLRDSEEIVLRYEHVVERAEKLDLGELSKLISEKSVNVRDDIDMKADIITESKAEQVKEQDIISLPVSADKTEKTAGQADNITGRSNIRHNEEQADNFQNNIHAKVAKMHHEGRDVNEIARKTRLSIAEISLILSILENKS